MATAKNAFTGEFIHAGALILRATGSGNLELFLNSLDNVHTAQLSSLVLKSSNNLGPTILSNFIDQRIQLQLQTVKINEGFVVSKITIFVKQVATGIPQ